MGEVSYFKKVAELAEMFYGMMKDHDGDLVSNAYALASAKHSREQMEKEMSKHTAFLGNKVVMTNEDSDKCQA